MTNPTPDLSALIDRVRMWNDSRKFGPHPEHGEIINFQVPPDEKTIDALLALSRWSLTAYSALETIERQGSKDPLAHSRVDACAATARIPLARFPSIS